MILVGSRDGRTQSARAWLFFFPSLYILYYFQEFKQQSNSIVLGNYLYSSHIYSSQTIVKWVARIDGGIQKKVKEPQPKSACACNPVFWRTGQARSQNSNPVLKSSLSSLYHLLVSLVVLLTWDCYSSPVAITFFSHTAIITLAPRTWLSGPGFQDSNRQN